MTLRILPETLVNRIAAGEVVERPASVVKELVENAIDAGARHIDVVLRDGGKSFISVSDDGEGLSRDDLELAVERHATSKLAGDDLVEIVTLGFRGEALASIGAIARMTLTARAAAMDEAWSITVEGGRKSQPIPAAHPIGARVEIRDLFYATPARLKFLKTSRTELNHAIDVVKRLAMAQPAIAFSFHDDDLLKLRLDPAQGDLFSARLDRLGAVMGREFADNAVPVDAEREGLHLTGYVGLPTLNRANAQAQYLLVNGRPVRDRLLAGAVRGAYQDVLARDRHPLLALFLDVAPEMVDVNVHPAKTEVRFRDAGLVRGLIVGAIKHALADAGHLTATTHSAAALGAFSHETAIRGTPYGGGSGHGARLPPGLAEAAAAYHAPLPGQAMGQALPGLSTPPGAIAEEGISADDLEALEYPLGAARGQLHGTYIVAQTRDGIVIVDQHAAHERLVYERMKRAIEGDAIERQGMLIPEVVELEEAQAQRLVARADELAELGLVFEAFGAGAVMVREVPALLGEANLQGLMRDLADEIAEYGAGLSLSQKLEEVCSTLACHSSVRAGRALNIAEMNALLREMEATPNSGQCSHGRPTYVELKLSDIEKLFGRR